MPDWLVPYLDPWTTPATLWFIIVAGAATLRLRGRRLAVLAAASAVAIALWKAWAIGPPNGLLDLTIYVGAASAWLDGSSLFSFHSLVFNLSATYPPIGVIPFALLSPVPIEVREVFFTTVSLGAVVFCARCAAVLAGVERERRIDWILWASALSIVTVPVWLTLRQGQVNAILWALVLGDVILIRRNSRFAGVAIGIATSIKLVPGLFIAWMLLAGWRRPAIRAIVSALALTGFGWLLAAEDSRRYWTNLLWHSERVGRLDDARNNSVLSGLSRVLEPGVPRTVLWLGLCAFLLVVGFRRAIRAGREDDLLTAVTIVGCLSALVSPISWTHHLGYLVLALASVHELTRGTLVRRSIFILLTIAVIDPGHLGDDAVVSFVRMLLMVTVVLGLPIQPGRSRRYQESAPIGRPLPTNDETSMDRVSEVSGSGENRSQEASTPRSRSTNS